MCYFINKTKMNIKQTANLIFNDLISYRIKYGYIKGIWKYLMDFYNGDFFEKEKQIKR